MVCLGPDLDEREAAAVAEAWEQALDGSGWTLWRKAEEDLGALLRAHQDRSPKSPLIIVRASVVCSRQPARSAAELPALPSARWL